MCALHLSKLQSFSASDPYTLHHITPQSVSYCCRGNIKHSLVSFLLRTSACMLQEKHSTNKVEVKLWWEKGLIYNSWKGYIQILIRNHNLTCKCCNLHTSQKCVPHSHGSKTIFFIYMHTKIKLLLSDMHTGHTVI